MQCCSHARHARPTRSMAPTYLHHEPQLVVLEASAALQEDADELGQIGMLREIAQHQILLFNLLQIVGDRLQDLDGYRAAGVAIASAEHLPVGALADQVEQFEAVFGRGQATEVDVLRQADVGGHCVVWVWGYCCWWCIVAWKYAKDTGKSNH